MSDSRNSGEERYFFPKEDRLSRKKIIQELFNNGSSFYLYPFIVKYADRLDYEGVQFLITVPKRKHPKAVARNSVKRLVKESIRLHKPRLDLTVWNQGLGVMLIYNAPKVLPFDLVQNKLILVLERLSNPDLIKKNDKSK